MARTKCKELEALSNVLLNILKDSPEINGKDFALDTVGITYRNSKGDLIRVRPSKINGPRKILSID